MNIMNKSFSLKATAVKACVCLSLVACGNAKTETEEDVQYVKTVQAERISDAAELSYPGKTKSSEEVNVAFRVSGPIQKVFVKEGQFVSKGQLIAQMDPRDY